MENIQTKRDVAIQIFKILFARSDGTPEGILEEFHKAFVEFKQLSNQDFKEAEHPRDKDGKFTDKGAGTPKTKTKHKLNISKFLKTEYKGLKGKDAIDCIRKNKRGWVSDAFYRKEIGDIGIFWGNKSLGLSHIIKRRRKTKQDLETLLSNLTEVINKGKLEPGYKNRLLLKYANKIVVLSPKEEINTFIVTAYFVY